MMKQIKRIYRFAVLTLATAMLPASFCACQSNDSNMHSETETIGQSVNSTDGLNGGYCDISDAATEIDSLQLSDFKETDQVTDHVKITVKDHGDIVIRLRADTAPLSVANFQKLVSEGFYNNVPIHRVMKGFMLQGGDPDGDGIGGSDETVKGEFSENGVKNDLSHIKGVISMARLGNNMDSATSQFFICNADASDSLDGKYAAFGYVVAGLKTVDSISAVEVMSNGSGEISSPIKPIYMTKVCFVTLIEEDDMVETESAVPESGSETLGS